VQALARVPGYPRFLDTAKLGLTASWNWIADDGEIQRKFGKNPLYLGLRLKKPGLPGFFV